MMFVGEKDPKFFGENKTNLVGKIFLLWKKEPFLQEKRLCKNVIKIRYKNYKNFIITYKKEERYKNFTNWEAH